MRRRLVHGITLLAISVSHCAYAQHDVEVNLLDKLKRASPGSERIDQLGRLAEHYYTLWANRKGDSILRVQLTEAEITNDHNAVFRTFFNPNISALPSFSSKETYERAYSLFQKALQFARQLDRKEYEAVAYLRLAALFRLRGDYAKGIQQAGLAALLLDKTEDSLKSALYVEFGDNHLAQGNAVEAFRYYNRAYDIAYEEKRYFLLSTIKHRYADLYQKLENVEYAKKSLLESMSINIQTRNSEGLLQDYIDLSRLTNDRQFLDRAISVADSVGSLKYQVISRRLMFYYLMVVSKSGHEALKYLEQNPVLKQAFLNKGRYSYEWAKGNAHRYGGRPDSAILYYTSVEPEITADFDNTNKYATYAEIGRCYALLDKLPESITYLEKALAVGSTLNDVAGNAVIVSELSELQARLKNYEAAYHYANQHKHYRDTLNTFSKEHEIALLDLEREQKARETDLADLAAQEARTRNLGYMLITLATALLFIILTVFGMFPVSRITIKMLNFFAFICLFEFIILLIDTWLHHLTHGNPLWIWIAKIFIIALLLPLHHTLEHVAIKFFSSKKLIRLREKLAHMRFWHPSKKTVAKVEKELENSTLV